MKSKLTIEGMKCEGCANRIKNILKNQKGIISYELSLEEKCLILEVKKEKMIEETVKKIENLGFKVLK